MKDDNNKCAVEEVPHRSTDQQPPPTHHHTVPLVQLELEAVTYAPATNQHKQQKRTGGLLCCRRGTTTASTTAVLSSVSTTIEPFQLTAWMGPSGSGKTSLVSVAAGLVPISSGAIRLNGEDVARTSTGAASTGIPKNLVGVVWQDDLLLSNLTVEESIVFCARLKTPRAHWDAVPDQVHAVLDELGLRQVQHARIGHGISGGERKRVAVACELVTSPSLLLCDEITSSLDSTTALSLMRTLQRIAQDHGHTIAVVIHQPRTEIFHLLDRLLLLQNGRAVYNGPAKDTRQYLERLNLVAALPPETGIADWIMDCILQDSKGALAEQWEQRHGQHHQKAITRNGEDKDRSGDDDKPPEHHGQAEDTTINTTHSAPSAEDDSLEDPISDVHFHPHQQQGTARRRMSSLKELHARPKFETTFWTQLQLLTQRTTQQMRGEKLTLMAGCLTLAYILFSALFWWRLPDTTDRIYERASLLFFMLIAQANGVVTTSIHVFQRERALLHRERSKGMYGVLPFFLAKTVSDMTNNVLLPCVYAGVTYWCANLRGDVTHFLMFMLIFYLIMNTAQSMGLCISIVIPSIDLALLLAPPITLFFMILGGFYIPLSHLHPVVQWISWLSFSRYGYSGMLVNEFAGRDIPCGDQHDVNVANNNTDYEYDVGKTVVSVCPLPGDDVVDSWGIQGLSVNYWFNVLILLAMQTAFRVLSYAVLRRNK